MGDSLYKTVYLDGFLNLFLNSCKLMQKNGIISIHGNDRYTINIDFVVKEKGVFIKINELFYTFLPLEIILDFREVLLERVENYGFTILFDPQSNKNNADLLKEGKICFERIIVSGTFEQFEMMHEIETKRAKQKIK